MKMLRYSRSFIIVFSLFTLALLFVAFASFSAEISLNDCRALGLPVLTIETDGAKKIKSKEKYLKATYILFGDETVTSGRCKIRGRGNTTWRTRELYKKPYLLKLNDAQPLLGFPPAQKWVLMANTADKTQIRNAYATHLAEKVWNNVGWTPQYRFISLFINGSYNGLYALTEKIETVEGRLPIREEDGSFLFEVNSRLNKEYNFRTTRGVPFSIHTNDFAGEEVFTERQNLIQRAEDMLFDDSGKTDWRTLFDMDSFADWYLINELTKNHDARFQSSCYLFYDATKGKIFMGPIWDFDISCGNINWDDCENPDGFWISTATWYEKMLSDTEFSALVKRRWKERRESLSESLLWLEETAQSLRPAVMLNDAVWKNIGHRQWPHAPGWKARQTYESEVYYMTDWLKKRIAWMDDALENI